MLAALLATLVGGSTALSVRSPADLSALEPSSGSVDLEGPTDDFANDIFVNDTTVKRNTSQSNFTGVLVPPSADILDELASEAALAATVALPSAQPSSVAAPASAKREAEAATREAESAKGEADACLLYTSPSPRDS